MSDIFKVYQVADLADLVAGYPLAWLCAADGDADHASLLPLLGEYDDAGTLTQLVGHMARRNPLCAALMRDHRAIILFQGPQGYVSPRQAGLTDWAPTWNYAQARIEAEIVFEPDLTEAALDLLIDAVEDDPAWPRAALGARYPKMLSAIIGFRARVTRIEAKFKLGQDEDAAVLRNILDCHPDAALVRWMTRFNRARL